MYALIKRFFDVVSSVLVLLVLSPFFVLIAILIALDSKGGVFYKQERIGKHQKPFDLFKFRSMKPESDTNLKITVGKDPRITRIGQFIRRFKIDEFPQLLNVIKGDMSIVGPRPEVKQYVDLYTDEQLKVLNVRPGLTDFATIEYISEQELLGKAKDPDKMYIEVIMPAKLKLNLKYIEKKSFTTDFGIIAATILKIFKQKA